MTTSALRTVVIGRAPPNVYGVLLTGPTDWWPIAEPDDMLDYSADVSALLEDVQANPVAVDVSVAPSGTGELTASNLCVVGDIITVWLAGGVPGRPYKIKILITTDDGHVFEVLIGLRIDPMLGSVIPPPPPSNGFGTPITWAYVPRFNFAVPDNSGYLALLSGF